MRNPGSIHAEKFWQTVLGDLYDAEKLEALAILPFVLMAQIQRIQTPGGGYRNVAWRVGSTAEPRRRPLGIAVSRKTLHLQVLRVIACNFFPRGEWLRLLWEAVDPEHFRMIAYLDVCLRMAPVGKERKRVHEFVRMFGMLERSRRGRLLLRREVCNNMTCSLPNLVR
jgi:hypothetical protein